MIRSMTAFARGETDTPWGRLICEIRSVNHRYLEQGFRMPETLRHVEGPLRDATRKRLERGKVDCALRLERPETGQGDLDETALEGLIATLARLRERLGDAAAPVDPLELLRWPGVLREARVDAEALTEAVRSLHREVLDGLVAHREREGAQLAELIETRLEAVAGIEQEVRAEADGLVAALRQRLAERARALEVELDGPRLEQEVALLAQKADVAEELDRLTTHIAEVRTALRQRGAVGRRLDFLAQELNREANTLAAKASSAGVAQRAVDLKVLIEQIREQIQNIE